MNERNVFINLDGSSQQIHSLHPDYVKFPEASVILSTRKYNEVYVPTGNCRGYIEGRHDLQQGDITGNIEIIFVDPTKVLPDETFLTDKIKVNESMIIVGDSII